MTSGKRPSFLVVGLGPSGGVLAARLRSSGVPVSGIDVWAEHVDAIRCDGLAVDGLMPVHARLDDVGRSVEELKHRRFDFVVIAVKAPVTPLVLPELEKIEGDFSIVCLQNGIDNELPVAERFGRERTIRAVANCGGVVDGPGRLRTTFFNKPNYVGCLCAQGDCGRARQLAELITGTGLDTEAVADVGRRVWKKTILNAALSPLCALLDMSMADAMSCPETRALVRSLLVESLEVARGVGHVFEDDFLDQGMEYLARAGCHKPSMLLDLRKGARTEIDSISGRIAWHGARLGIPAPLNAALTAMIKAREMMNAQGKKP